MSHDSPEEMDLAEQRLIPLEWRVTLRQIVDQFVVGDYRLKTWVAGVEPIDASCALQIQKYVEDYGVTLAPLPEETWESSVCIWYGEHWEAVVDLWTKEEGRSDLVLHAHITPANPGFLFRIYSVYVP